MPTPDQNVSIQYFLRDTITVDPKRMHQFEKLMATKIIQIFESTGWHLINASFSVTSNTNTVVHLWDMPSADSLLSNMLKFLEDQDYATLHSYISDEHQEILTPTRMCPVTDYPKESLEQNLERLFLYQTIVVKKDQMPTFLRSLSTLLPVFNARGWKLINSAYAVTGRPSTIANLFEVQDPADLVRLPTSFRKGPFSNTFAEWVGTISVENRRIISPMVYCPMIEQDINGWLMKTHVVQPLASHGFSHLPLFFGH